MNRRMVVKAPGRFRQAAGHGESCCRHLKARTMAGGRRMAPGGKGSVARIGNNDLGILRWRAGDADLWKPTRKASSLQT